MTINVEESIELIEKSARKEKERFIKSFEKSPARSINGVMTLIDN